MSQPKIDIFLGSERRPFWADATGDTLAQVVTPAGSYFAPSYDVLDAIAAYNKLLLVTALRNPFVVSFWGSHPDDENDDCWIFCPSDRKATVKLTLHGGEKVSCRAVRVATRHARIRGFS